MKRKIAATLIGLCFLLVLATHAFLTWGAIDTLPAGLPQDDKEFFEFSLFLESFGVAVIVSYLIGSRIYLAVGESQSAAAFQSQKTGMKGIVGVWVGAAIILRRLSFFQITEGNKLETILIVAIAAIPIIRLILAKLSNRKKTTEPIASGQRLKPRHISTLLGTEIMQKQSFKLFADYFQFYLWDEEVSPDAPIDYSDDDVTRRLKAEPNVVVVQPIRNMTVPVTVEVQAAEPLFDATDWDHIAECSLSLPSGRLQVHECTGESVARFSVTPGAYRVRAFFGALDSLDESGFEGDDHYTVVLWPAPEAELRVLKQWIQK